VADRRRLLCGWKGTIRPFLRKEKPAAPKAEAVRPSALRPGGSRRKRAKVDAKTIAAGEELKKGLSFFP